MSVSGSLTLRQFVATLWTDSTLGTASTESQFALKELRVERGLSCFSSRYWVVSTDPAVLSATGSPVSQCLSSSDGSQLRPPSWSRILKRDIITIWPWIINVAKLSTNLTLKLLSHVLRPTAANLAWLLSTAQRSSVEKSELMKARVEEF